LRTNFLATFVRFGGIALIQFVCVPLYIRYLGIEAYGLVGFYVMLQATLRILDLGLSPTMNREMARYSVQAGKSAEMRDFVRTFELGYWVIGAAVGLLVCLAATPITTRWISFGALSVHQVEQSVMLMGAVIAVQWPLSLYQGAFMGLQRQVLLAVIMISGALLSGVGAVLVLKFVSANIVAFFVWQLLVGVGQAIVTAIALWQCLPAAARRSRVDVRLVHGVLRFAGGMTVIGVFAAILTQMDKIVLSRLLPLTEFGYYTLAGLMASSLQLFVAPIFNAIFPRLSSLVAQGQDAAVSGIYHDGSQAMTVLVVPLAGVLAAFSQPILQLWTGNAVVAEHAAPLALFLIAGSALNGLMHLPYSLQLSYGWTSIGVATTVAMCIVFLPAVYLMATQYGAVGAALVWLMLNAVYVLVGVPLTHRRLLRGEALRWFGEDVGVPAAVALAVILLSRQFLVPTTSTRIGTALDIGFVLAVAVLCAAASAPRIRTRLRFRSGGVSAWWGG
jgi:O-antigen/teichoic acid export membrane protein